jgi:steroid 5-alpha reductase family enzyme
MNPAPTGNTVADGTFAGDAFAATLVWSVLALLVVLLATYLISRVVHKHSVIDTAWGLLFCAVALVSFVRSADDGGAARRWLLLAMTLVWGLRLAVHIGRRSIGAGEDPRYAEMLRDRGTLQTIALVYGLQGALAFLISMPLLVSMFCSGSLTPLAYLGAAIWLVGLFFEGVGDWQMENFRAAKARGTASGVLDHGLWRYTRHPNYFGDACVWVGIFCVAAERWPGVLTVFSPVIMVYLLAFGSGKKVLERSMANRPGYREYMQRTSGFIPRPPR